MPATDPGRLTIHTLASTINPRIAGSFRFR
jgi:hypothetical protein